MIKIYHNPRCTKSRQGLALLEESGKAFEIVLYLDKVPTKKELKQILKKLGVAPLDLIRKNEAVWKEHFKGKQLTDEELIDAMVKFPKLIERPIVITPKGAVIGRPTEKIREII